MTGAVIVTQATTTTVTRSPNATRRTEAPSPSPPRWRRHRANPSGVGTVTFKDGATAICSNVALVGNSASCALSTLLAGSHSITAAYSGTTSGSPAYGASTSSALSHTVNAKSITGSFTASNKVYDGATAATISGRSLSGVVGSDDVALAGGSATFANKNIGAGKTVTGTGFSLSGGTAPNYTLASSTLTTAADITAKALSVSGAVANNKNYDGGMAATVNFDGATLVGVVSPDVVTLDSSAYAASFASKTVGAAKAVTVTGVALGGAGAGNYTVSQPTGLTANITARALTVSAAGVNKVYDGTTAATVTLSDNRVSGDVFTSSYANAAFADKNVGSGKTVSVSGISVTGGDSGNYTFNTTATTTANITARPITVTADPKTKSFGASDPALTYQVTSGSLVGSDAFTGALVRDAGEAVGSYAIRQDTLSAGTNYALTYVGANLAITATSSTLAADNATVTVSEGQTALNTGTWSDPGVPVTLFRVGRNGGQECEWDVELVVRHG